MSDLRDSCTHTSYIATSSVIDADLNSIEGISVARQPRHSFAPLVNFGEKALKHFFL